MRQKELLHTLCTLWKHPRSSQQDILAFQNRKLRYLIRHAHAHVPYYQRLLDRSGIDPQRILSADDLRRMPITEKNDLRACPHEDILIRGARPERLVSRITSGSSGRPFVMWRSWPEDHIINMFRVRAEQQYGLRLHDKTMLLLAAYIPGQRCKTKLTAIRQAAGVHRRYRVDCLQPVEAIYRQMKELDPDIIVGYPGAVAHLATFAKGKFSSKKLRYISCGGESLTLAKRKIIEDVFGVRVFDALGTNECNIVSWECPHTGLQHICDDNIVAEVTRNGQPVKEGEQGELVITSLHSYTMPFIRYRMGDMVVKGPDQCPCGQPFSTFQSIGGRIREYFLLPDGRHVHPLEAVLEVITECAPWLNQFQMTQETKTRFVLRVTLMRKPKPEEIQSLNAIVTQKLGQGAEFRIEIVDDIPFEANGKFKDCRSLIQPDKDTGPHARICAPHIIQNSVADGLRAASFPLYGLIQHSIVTQASPETFAGALRNIAKEVSKRNAGILSQTIYAPAGFMQQLLPELKAPGKSAWPVTWLEHPGKNDTPLCTIQTNALSGSHITHVKHNGVAAASLFESAYATFCFLGNISAPDKTATRARQALQTFSTMNSLLQAAGMDFCNVMRTWFYLDDIFSQYAAFNAERTKFFSDQEVYKTRIPASTAVGMANPSGAGIIANALAIQPKSEAISINEVTSPLQCPAPDYNTTFSRAMEVTLPDCRCLYISGTASIDPEGKTAHCGNIEKQIALTMEVVEKILASRAMGWTDVTKATAYLKDIRNTGQLIHYLRGHGMGELPLVIAQADICREDLLFELDAEAVTGA